MNMTKKQFSKIVKNGNQENQS